MNTYRVGKLNINLLGELLCAVKNKDPRVIIGPKVGEDAAVIGCEYGANRVRIWCE